MGLKGTAVSLVSQSTLVGLSGARRARRLPSLSEVISYLTFVVPPSGVGVLTTIATGTPSGRPVSVSTFTAEWSGSSIPSGVRINAPLNETTKSFELLSSVKNL